MRDKPVIRRRMLWLVTCWMAASLVATAGQKPAAPRALTPTDIFQPTTIWTAHLTFTADQFKAMEPTRAPVTNRNGEWLQGAPGNRNGSLEPGG